MSLPTDLGRRSAAVAAWARTREVGPAMRETLAWLAEGVDYDLERMVQTADVAVWAGISASASRARLLNLQRAGLVFAVPTSTTKVRQRYLVEIRHPDGPREAKRQRGLQSLRRWTREYAEGEAERRRRWAAREEAILRGIVTPDEILQASDWGR